MGNGNERRSVSRDGVRPAALWDMDRKEPTGSRRSKTRPELGEFYREWNGETDQRQGMGCQLTNPHLEAGALSPAI